MTVSEACPTCSAARAGYDYCGTCGTTAASVAPGSRANDPAAESPVVSREPAVSILDSLAAHSGLVVIAALFAIGIATLLFVGPNSDTSSGVRLEDRQRVAVVQSPIAARVSDVEPTPEASLPEPIARPTSVPRPSPNPTPTLDAVSRWSRSTEGLVTIVWLDWVKLDVSLLLNAPESFSTRCGDYRFRVFRLDTDEIEGLPNGQVRNSILQVEEEVEALVAACGSTGIAAFGADRLSSLQDLVASTRSVVAARLEAGGPTGRGELAIGTPSNRRVWQQSLTTYPLVQEFLSLRRAPSLSATIITTLKPSETVTLTDQIQSDDGFEFRKVVVADGREGWVGAQYLAGFNPPCGFYVNTQSLNVRTGPSTMYPLRTIDGDVVRLSETTAVAPIDVIGDWYMIDLPLDGWVVGSAVLSSCTYQGIVPVAHGDQYE